MLVCDLSLPDATIFIIFFKSLTPIRSYKVRFKISWQIIKFLLVRCWFVCRTFGCHWKSLYCYLIEKVTRIFSKILIYSIQAENSHHLVHRDLESHLSLLYFNLLMGNCLLINIVIGVCHAFCGMTYYWDSCSIHLLILQLSILASHSFFLLIWFQISNIEFFN